MFLNVIQMAEDRASAAAMVEMKTEKLLVLCVNIIWRERRFSVRGRRKSDEIGISEFLRGFSYLGCAYSRTIFFPFLYLSPQHYFRKTSSVGSRFTHTGRVTHRPCLAAPFPEMSGKIREMHADDDNAHAAATATRQAAAEQ